MVVCSSSFNQSVFSDAAINFVMGDGIGQLGFDTLKDFLACRDHYEQEFKYVVDATGRHAARTQKP